MRKLTLDKVDQLKLEEGLKAGADKEEQDLAAKVLKRFGYVKEATQAAKRKRGPKPKRSTNSTQEELRVRVEYLRLMFDDTARNLSSKQILSLLERFLRQFEQRCSTGIFLSDRSISKFQESADNLKQKGEELSGFLRPVGISPALTKYVPTSQEMQDWIKNLAEWSKSGDRLEWKDFLNKAIKLEPAIGSESQVYSSIQILLGLALEGPSLSDIDSQIARHQNLHLTDPDEILENKLDIKSLEIEKWLHEQFPITSKNQVLSTATSKLYRIRSVIEGCRWTAVDINIDRLYTFVHRISNEGDPRDVPDEIAKLDELFLESLADQETSPFSDVFPEETDPGPAYVPEDGQLFALPSKVESSLVETIVQILLATDNQRVHSDDLVKKIVEIRGCNKSTVYRYIDQAIAEEKVLKTGKILSLRDIRQTKSGAP